MIMFEKQIYKETKAKKFASDKERKRYFAIKNNYKKKAAEKAIMLKLVPNNINSKKVK